MFLWLITKIKFLGPLVEVHEAWASLSIGNSLVVKHVMVLLGLAATKLMMRGRLRGSILRGEPSVERVSIPRWDLVGFNLKPLNFLLKFFIQGCRCKINKNQSNYNITSKEKLANLKAQGISSHTKVKQFHHSFSITAQTYE